MVQSNRKDILASESDNLLIANGDFVVGESNDQHIRHIIMGNAGDYPEKPKLGVGFQRYQHASLTPETKAKWRRLIQIHLILDGYDDRTISI